MLSRATLVVVHLVGDALLLWLGYRWLGMSESSGSNLVASFAMVLVMIAGVAWLHGLALSQFGGLPVRRAAVRSLRCLAPLTGLCVLALAVYAALIWLQSNYAKAAFEIASFLTLHLRTPVPPSAIQRIFHVIVLTLDWGIVPAALLRISGRIAAENPIRRRNFWLFSMAVAALLFCAIRTPFKLFFWIPTIASFNGQLLSFVVRAGAGYLLFVVCILLLEFITVAGMPFETQASTAV